MRIINLIWLATGIALIIWSVIELWQIGHNSYLGVSSGAFKSTLIGAGFSLICIIGALSLLFRKAWGRVIILIAAIFSIIYAVGYLLLGGVEDTGRIYIFNVAALFLLSIATIIVLVKNWRLKKYKT